MQALIYTFRSSVWGLKKSLGFCCHSIEVLSIKHNIRVYYLIGGLEHDFLIFPYIGNLHPNWRTHICQRDRSTTNQLWYIAFDMNDGWLMISSGVKKDNPFFFGLIISSHHGFTIWLWLTVRHGWAMAPIEIDGLPNLIAWWIFPWQTVHVITRGLHGFFMDFFGIIQICYYMTYNMIWYGYGSIPIDTFLVGWTSIYQLFWGSLGTRVLTHPHIVSNFHEDYTSHSYYGQ